MANCPQCSSHLKYIKSIQFDVCYDCGFSQRVERPDASTPPIKQNKIFLASVLYWIFRLWVFVFLPLILIGQGLFSEDTKVDNNNDNSLNVKWESESTKPVKKEQLSAEEERCKQIDEVINTNMKKIKAMKMNAMANNDLQARKANLDISQDWLDGKLDIDQYNLMKDDIAVQKARNDQNIAFDVLTNIDMQIKYGIDSGCWDKDMELIFGEQYKPNSPKNP